MPVIPIDDLADPRVADYRNVPDPELLRGRGVFVAEGRYVVRRLLATTRFVTRSLLLTPAAYDSLADVHTHRDSLPTYLVSQDAMNAITGFNIHRGCLAIGERPASVPWQTLARDARRLVVLEGVANADNIGGVFRNAAALGADAVLLGPSCTDPLYRKAIRTSMGAALQVPFARMEQWPDDLVRLRASGVTLLALTPAADAIELAQLHQPAVSQRVGIADRVALLLGHEGEGLSHAAVRAADVRVRIPMEAGVDSLNVATAAAIALYELRR
jgi:tRNA G18 (ribose-2'-O)-methylase SpoU